MVSFLAHHAVLLEFVEDTPRELLHLDLCFGII
jgi:hypothetical protein